MGDEAQVERMVDAPSRELGGIDVLMAAEALSYASMARAPTRAIGSWTSRWPTGIGS